jgi:hypothetical protein
MQKLIAAVLYDINGFELNPRSEQVELDLWDDVSEIVAYLAANPESDTAANEKKILDVLNSPAQTQTLKGKTFYAISKTHAIFENNTDLRFLEQLAEREGFIKIRSNVVVLSVEAFAQAIKCDGTPESIGTPRGYYKAFNYYRASWLSGYIAGRLMEFNKLSNSELTVQQLTDSLKDYVQGVMYPELPLWVDVVKRQEYLFDYLGFYHKQLTEHARRTFYLANQIIVKGMKLEI